MRLSPYVLSAGVLALCGCAVGPNYQPEPVDLPPIYQGGAEWETSPPNLEPTWWTLFGDQKLDALEAQALETNLDLKVAVAKVLEARAGARSIASQYYPVVTLDPSIIRARTPDGSGGGTTVTTTRVPFDLSYEVDVWGRVRRSVEAADAQARASAADWGVVLQTVTSDVAVNYYSLRSLDAQEKILAETLELLRREVDLTHTRQHAGIVAPTDAIQAQLQVDVAETGLIEVRRQRQDAEHAIAVLTGQPPSSLSIEPLPLTGTPVLVPAGLPAELLKRRSDVAEAETNLMSASAAIGVAEANFYPVFRLTGSAGYESINIAHTLDWQNRVWSFGPSVSMPIFEGGKLRADLAQAKARYEELRATYHSVVLGAIRDVEDSLTDLHLRADASAAEERAVAEAAEYLRLTKIQYTQGIVSYLQVIDAERSLLTNQLTATQILNQRFASTVLLIKALGGGWDPGDFDARMSHDDSDKH